MKTGEELISDYHHCKLFLKCRKSDLNYKNVSDTCKDVFTFSFPKMVEKMLLLAQFFESEGEVFDGFTHFEVL